MSLARARALAIVGVLVVAALVLVVTAIIRDRQSDTSYAGGGCTPGKTKISTRLPPESDIKLNVYNGTGELTAQKKIANGVTGLASQVADDLRNRGFKILKVTDNPQKFDRVAKLIYASKGFSAVTVERGDFLGEIDLGGLYC